jgi:hypothetical protein
MAEKTQRLVERDGQVLELVVDRDPYRLKGAGRRMDAEPAATADRSADSVRQIQGSAQRPFLDDAPGNGPAMTLLAVAPNEIG